MKFKEALALAGKNELKLVSYFRIKDKTVLCLRGKLVNVVEAIAGENVTQFDRNDGLFSREYVVKIEVERPEVEG